MSSLFLLIVLSAVTGIGGLALGGAFASFPQRDALSSRLLAAFTAGIMLSVVFFHILPEAVEHGDLLTVSISATLGGALPWLLHVKLGHHHHHKSEDLQPAAWVLAGAVALHNLPIGMALGLFLGIVAGLINCGTNKFLKYVATAYIETIRGTPLIVQVMFLYFGLPLALGVRIPPVTAGVIAIGVNAGAYIAEIVRGAIISIHHGQEEAARSTGLNKFQTMLYVIWPQAFRRMIPPLGNQFIISLKDTSLLVVIGVAELTRRGQEIISINFKAFEIWLAVALLYLCLTLSLSYLLRLLERRMNAKIMKN